MNNYKAELLVDIIKWVLEYDCDEQELYNNILLILNGQTEDEIQEKLQPFFEFMKSKEYIP